MNNPRTWCRFPLVTVLLGSLSLAFADVSAEPADDIRAKAEIAREEAAYLESKPLEQWFIENGVADTIIPDPALLLRYVPGDHAVRKRGGKDPFGNAYVLGSLRQGVAVNAKTIELCAEVTKTDPLFWGHHDERVLGLIEAARGNDIDAVRSLVKTVPDPNIRNKVGDTALELAMAQGNDEMEKILASHGAVLDPGDGRPLWLAIQYQNVTAVSNLIDRFPYMVTATCTSAGSDGVLKTWQPAIRYAADTSNAEMVQILLEHGADPNTLDGYPLWVSVYDGHFNTVRLLVEAGAQITPEELGFASGEMREYLKSRLGNVRTKEFENALSNTGSNAPPMDRLHHMIERYSKPR